MSLDLSDMLILLGVALICGAVALWSLPVALIVGGLASLFAGVVTGARPRGER